MERGWVKLWRKLLDSEIFQNEGLLKVAIWALLKANHKEAWVPLKTGRGKTIVHLKPGQFIFGRRTAAKELKMPESSVRVAVHRLRRRYRKLLRDEIAQTVSAEDQIDEEMGHLFSALAQ